jgi:hypothetical protein
MKGDDGYPCVCIGVFIENIQRTLFCVSIAIEMAAIDERIEKARTRKREIE